jgi:hypothetical protein
MLKYFITLIVDGKPFYYEKDESEIEDFAQNILGGWTSHSAMVSGGENCHEKSFVQAGVTNKNQPFSIIAVWVDK